MAKKNEVSIWIRAKDLASGTFKSFERNMRAAWRTAKNVTMALVGMGAAATAAVVGLGKLAERGAKVTTVSAAFERATQGQADALERLRRASGGMISDFDLMQQANQAIALGSARNVEEFERMLRISQSLARSLGVDMSFALESLNTGIARQSKLRLDNLAILIDVDAENRKYAATLGKEVKELADLDKRNAFRAAALREGERLVAKMGESTGGAGDAWVRLETALANGRDRLAEIAAQSPDVQEFFNTLIDAVDELSEKLPGVVQKLAQVGVKFAEILGLSNPVARKIQSNVREIAGARGEEGLQAHQRVLEARLRTARQQLVEKLDEGVMRGFIDPKTGKAIPDRSLSSFVRRDPERLALMEEVERLENGIEGIESGLEYLGQVLNTFARETERNTTATTGGGGGGGARVGPFRRGSGIIPDLRDNKDRVSEVSFPTFGEMAASVSTGRPEEPEEPSSAAMLASVGAFQSVGAAMIDSSRQAEELRRQLESGEISLAQFNAAMQDVGFSLERHLLPSLTNVAAAAAGTASPVAGAVVGAVGGLLSAAFGGRDRPRVVVDEYSPRAISQRRQEQAVVRDVFFNGQQLTDERVRQLGYRQGRIARLRGESPTGVG